MDANTKRKNWDAFHHTLVKARLEKCLLADARGKARYTEKDLMFLSTLQSAVALADSAAETISLSVKQMNYLTSLARVGE